MNINKLIIKMKLITALVNQRVFTRVSDRTDRTEWTTEINVNERVAKLNLS